MASSVLPGFVDVGWAHRCVLEVYLTEPVVWGDSARALLRPLLQPDPAAPRSCPAPEVRVFGGYARARGGRSGR